jgi:O-antigen ligase
MANLVNKTVGARDWTAMVLPGAVVLFSLISVGSLNDPATLPRTLIWAIALLGWTLLHLAQSWKAKDLQKPEVPRLLLGSLAALLMAHLLSLVAAHSLAEGILATSRIGLMLVGMVWIAWQIQAGKAQAKQAWVIGIWSVGTAQTVIALGQTFVFPTQNPYAALFHQAANLPPEGTQQNSNLLGSLIALCLPAALHLILHGTRPWKIAAGLSIPMMLGTVYLSASRTALLILLAYAVLFAFSAVALLKESEFLRARKGMFWGASLLLVVGAAALLYFGWGRKEMPKTYKHLWDNQAVITPKTSSIEVRMILWNKSLQMAKAHPLTGVGAGNWKLEIPAYGVKGYDEKARYGMVFYTRPHNDYLWVFAETGLLGLLGYLGMLGGLIALAVKLIRRQPDAEARSLARMALWGIVAFMIDACFSFPGERLENTVILGAFGGMLIALNAHRDRVTTRSFAPKALAFAGLGLLAFVTILAAYRWPMDAATLKMRNAKAKQKWKEMGQLATRADSWWNRYEANSATPYAWYKAVALVETNRANLAKVGNEALKEVRRAIDAAPYNLLALTELGSTHAQLNQFPEAIAAYKAVVATFPDNDEAWVNLAVCYLNHQQPAQAREALTHVAPAYTSPTLVQLRLLL